MTIRVYMDNCCFNRPFDDPLHVPNWLEAEAKIHVQRQILAGDIELAWSYILDYENAANPYGDRRDAIAQWKARATVDIGAGNEIVHRALAIAQCGIRNKDSLHIARAIETQSHVFLTTDKGILKKNVEGIRLMNPLDFVREIEVGP